MVIGGAHSAGAKAELTLGVVVRPGAGWFFEVRAEDLRVEGGGGGLPDLVSLAALEEFGEGDWDQLVEADDDDGVGDAECGFALAPSLTGGALLDFPDFPNFPNSQDTSVEAVRAAYRPQDWVRLTRVKRRYDPRNTLRVNHSIPPRG
ncbi:BBE domain-containing protein [Streptomyces polyrhachis]|uniref:BBE domain-containing protein n=1 Tax=Streptomyces polyrhachis TaxID=1282885 RepID=A0ABW2GM48_9ACTN